VAPSVRIENEAKWNLVWGKLDAVVKEALDVGNEVELS